MTRNSVTKKKPKLTDAQRHRRFVAMAKDVGASDDPKDFEKAFQAITKTPDKPQLG